MNHHNPRQPVARPFSRETLNNGKRGKKGKRPCQARPGWKRTRPRKSKGPRSGGGCNGKKEEGRRAGCPSVPEFWTSSKTARKGEKETSSKRCSETIRRGKKEDPTRKRNLRRPRSSEKSVKKKAMKKKRVSDKEDRRRASADFEAQTGKKEQGERKKEREVSREKKRS